MRLLRKASLLAIVGVMGAMYALPAWASHSDGGVDEAWTNDMNQASYWEARFGMDCEKFENHSGFIPAGYDAAVIKDGNMVRVYQQAGPFTASGAVNPNNGQHFSAPHSWVMKCQTTTTTTQPTTTIPEETTTLPEVTTTLPEVTTTAPTTTLPEVTTTIPEETTTLPGPSTTEGGTPPTPTPPPSVCVPLYDPPILIELFPGVLAHYFDGCTDIYEELPPADPVESTTTTKPLEELPFTGPALAAPLAITGGSLLALGSALLMGLRRRDDE